MPYFKHKLKKTDIPMVVNLGRTELSLREVLDLEQGDIVRLDNRLDQMLEVIFGDTPKFRGKPGIYRGHKAVQIVSEIREGVIQNE